MALLLYDAELEPEVSAAHGPLLRRDIGVVAAPAAKLVEQARGLGPDLVLLSDRSGEPWARIDELGADPDLAHLRLLLLSARRLAAGEREALAGAGVSVLDLPQSSEQLGRAIAVLLDVPTRVAVRTEVAFEVASAGASGAIVFGRLLDLSTSGLRLESGHRLEAGEELRLRFELPDGGEAVYATARVARRGEEGLGPGSYGCEFRDIRLADRRRISALVLGQRDRPV